MARKSNDVKMSSESPVGKRRVDRPAQLLQLFEEKIRPLLEAEQHVRVDGLVRHADVLRASLARPERLQVGFLGESQVGKSSLINAVVGQTVLPSGGLGPLTAQATTVTRDGDSGVLTARYHTRVELNQLLFGLRRLETAGPTNVEVAPGDDTEEDGDTDPSAPAAVSRRQYMLGQAELLLTDGHSGSTPIPQILDGLRLSLGHSVVRDVPEAIRGSPSSACSEPPRLSARRMGQDASSMRHSACAPRAGCPRSLLN